MGQFSIIPARAVIDRGLPRGALLVLAAVGLHARTEGWCWPSQSRLADLAGISRQQVGKYLAILCERGLLERRSRSRSDGGRASDEMRILYDSTPATLEIAGGATSEVSGGATSEVAGPATSEVSARKNKKKEQLKGNTVLPPWLPEKEWEAFVEMRKKVKAPLTDLAIRNIWEELLKLEADGDSPAEVLMQSVTNAWRFVFPLKKQRWHKSKNSYINDQALEEFNRRIDEQERVIDA